MSELNQMLIELDAQQKRAQKIRSHLTKICSAIKENDLTALVPDELPNLKDFKIEFTKLQHRLAVLQKSIDEMKESTSQGEEVTTSCSILEDLSAIFMTAVKTAFPQVAGDFENKKSFPLTVSTKPHFGDYQCNVAMGISKGLKSKGLSVPPKDVAAKIKDCVPTNAIVSNIEIANPGYLNVWLSKDFLKSKLIELVLEGAKPPVVKSQRVVVDFSSPNIAKEMHVGHLRSTIIGDSICRLLEYLGHDVLRLNHVGDWGTQFGMLIAHLQDKFPNFVKESPPISDLQAFYKESKARFDEDPAFKARAYASVVKLQSSDPDHIKAWNLICDVSRREFQLIYDRLGISLIERGESFYHSRMEELVKSLEAQNYLEEDEGRKVMFGLNRDEIPFTVVKSDGGYTYDTSDLACIKQRIEEEKGDRLIYVTDSGQGTHFKVLFSCATHCKILDPSKVRADHVGFGLVLGEDKKKFKTRSGDTIRLCDLLDEGLSRAEQKLLERERQKVLSPEEFQLAKEAVAYGCIKYADLSHNRIIDYVFSFDKMLEDKGNTAVYLLYANTRIRSIARKAGVTQDQLKEFALKEPVIFNHEKEWKLIKILLRFPEIILSVVEDLLLHRLCDYIYEVAGVFTEFYDSCFCIEKDPSGKILQIHMQRLLLCEATSIIIEKGFDILGLKPVQKM